MQTITINGKGSQKRALVEAGVTVKFGLDVHAEQITVCRQIGNLVPQPAPKFSWSAAIEWIEAHVKAGAVVYTCYEAGPCGYGLHWKLTALGVANLVVAPQRWDDQHQRVKTDARDARELCARLDRYVSGNPTVFTVVRVPTPEEEQRRAVGRQRGMLLKERHRSVVRGHGLMLSQGVHAPGDWWEPKVWAHWQFELPEWLRAQVQVWQQNAVRLDAEMTPWTALVEEYAAGQIVPKGVGLLTAGLLALEILDWRRFQNRRQVASYTGLCPSEYTSDQRRRQGAITKHGNPRVRHQLVEAVWRLLQWQADYPPLRRLRAAVGQRTRKRFAVAAARRQAIDLWRINTGQCSAQQLGLKLR
jgi:transposase